MVSCTGGEDGAVGPARAQSALLDDHWDRIAAALRAGDVRTAPALNRFWQSLPTLLEAAARETEEVADSPSPRNELGQMKARLGELSTQVVNLQAIIETQESQVTLLRSALLRAEEIRKLTLNRCHQFRTTFEDQVAVYRSQRAWQVMLWCRKAYALFFSSPLAGKARFIKFALASLFGQGNRSEQELSFPSLSAYMPKQVMDPFALLDDSAGSSASISPSVLSSDLYLPRLPHPQKYDVVVLGIIDYDFRFQRPQQLALRFAREGHRVFWISPTRYLSPSNSQAYELLELQENLWEIHLRGEQPDIYMGSLDEAAVRGFHDALCKFYRQAGIVESCCFVQLPFWRQLALGLRASFGATVLYDCMDDWDTFPRFGSFNHSEERLLAPAADVLLVTAQKLVEKFERPGVQPLLVRNGADFEFFTRMSREKMLLPAVKKPIIGYFGAIADWMDLALVYEVACSRPGYSFVLIGKVFGRNVSRLESLSNVHLLGHREYAEIPSYLREFDVCMIPFLLNDVTNATDPVKMYEYFSQGKPVVATAMAELEAWSDLLYIARSPTEFAEKLDQAVAEKSADLAQRRIEFARSNTWQHRYGAIDVAIANTFPLISILIVTYNSAEFILPCLNSILRNTTYPNIEVIIVDNASQDDTPSLVKRYTSSHNGLKEFCLSENLGFAGGNNFAAGHAAGEYLVFLNADTLVTVGWLENLVRHCRRDGAIGLVTPVTNFAGNETKLNVDYRNQAEMEEFGASLTRENSGRSFELEAAPLYCALMPRPVWECVGPLDEVFSIGMFEDDDLSMRVRAGGFRVVAAEDCFVHHFGQGSFSKLDAGTYQRIFEQNRLLYERKWGAKWKPHKPRDGVRPAFEEQRFEPGTFCGASSSGQRSASA